MDKQVAGLLVFCCSIVMLFLLPGAFDALFALVFVGMIPFTSLTIPPLVMLITYSGLILLGMRWIAKQSITPLPEQKGSSITSKSVSTRHHTKTTHTSRHTPRRRYHQTAKI